LYLSTNGTHGAVSSQGETEFTERASFVKYHGHPLYFLWSRTIQMAIIFFLYFFLLFGSQLTRRHKVNSKNKDSILLVYNPSNESCSKTWQRSKLARAWDW
jgi:hypothetical protein